MCSRDRPPWNLESPCVRSAPSFGYQVKGCCCLCDRALHTWLRDESNPSRSGGHSRTPHKPEAGPGNCCAGDAWLSLRCATTRGSATANRAGPHPTVHSCWLTCAQVGPAFPQTVRVLLKIQAWSPGHPDPTGLGQGPRFHVPTSAPHEKGGPALGGGAWEVPGPQPLLGHPPPNVCGCAKHHSLWGLARPHLSHYGPGATITKSLDHWCDVPGLCAKCPQAGT